jgi:hypothetical protein
MNPKNGNQVLVAENQIMRKSQFACLEANQSEQWEIPAQFCLTQVENLNAEPPTTNLAGFNNCTTTTNATSVTAATSATPVIPTNVVICEATASPSATAPVAPRCKHPI